MAKYSFEFKLQVVNDYLDGNGWYRYLATNLQSKCNIKK